MRIEGINSTPINVTVRCRSDDGKIIRLSVEMDTLESAVGRWEVSENEARHLIESRRFEIERLLDEKYQRGEVTENLNLRADLPPTGGFKIYDGGAYMEMSITEPELRRLIRQG